MKLAPLKVAAGLAISIFALAACDTGTQRQTEQERGTTTEQGTPEQGGEEQSQVLEQDTRTTETGQLGERAMKEGEAQVEGERVTVRRETERMQEEVPTITTGQKKADINEMEQKDFVALGLSPNAAESIIQYREQQGRFSSVDELRQVPGMDTSWFTENRDKLGVAAEVGGQETQKEQEQKQSQ